MLVLAACEIGHDDPHRQSSRDASHADVAVVSHDAQAPDADVDEDSGAMSETDAGVPKDAGIEIDANVDVDAATLIDADVGDADPRTTNLRDANILAAGDGGIVFVPLDMSVRADAALDGEPSGEGCADCIHE